MTESHLAWSHSLKIRQRGEHHSPRQKKGGRLCRLHSRGFVGRDNVYIVEF